MASLTTLAQRRLKATAPLDTVISPRRPLFAPLLGHLHALDRGNPGRPIIVVLAEFVPTHWWDALLHNQTALLLKLRLFTRRNTSVLDGPTTSTTPTADE